MTNLLCSRLWLPSNFSVRPKVDLKFWKHHWKINLLEELKHQNSGLKGTVKKSPWTGKPHMDTWMEATGRCQERNLKFRCAWGARPQWDISLEVFSGVAWGHDPNEPWSLAIAILNQLGDHHAPPPLFNDHKHRVTIKCPIIPHGCSMTHRESSSSLL